MTVIALVFFIFLLLLILVAAQQFEYRTGQRFFASREEKESERALKKG
jgi:hypothetical protein